MKVCVKCGDEKKLDAFRWIGQRGKYTNTCKVCLARQGREYFTKHQRSGHNRHTAPPIREEMAVAIAALPYRVDGAENDNDDAPLREDCWTWYVVEVHPGGLTLDEIGQLMGCTRERVRQIENKALRKLSRVIEPLGVPGEMRRSLRELFALRAEKVEYDQWSAAS